MRMLITKTRLFNFDPLKPHFYIVKLGFTEAYIIFLISAKNIDCGYSLEPPRRGSSNEYPQSMFWAEIWRISDFFLSENFHFLVMKFSLYLNRLVFIMWRIITSPLPNDLNMIWGCKDMRTDGWMDGQTVSAWMDGQNISYSVCLFSQNYQDIERPWPCIFMKIWIKSHV